MYKTSLSSQSRKIEKKKNRSSFLSLSDVDEPFFSSRLSQRHDATADSFTTTDVPFQRTLFSLSLFFSQRFLLWKKNVENTGAQKKHRRSTKKHRTKKGPKKKRKKIIFFSTIVFSFSFLTQNSLFGIRDTHTRETFIDIISSKRARAHRNVRNKNTFNNNHGDHVREIVPASLFEERDAHFDGAREFLYLFFIAFSSEVNVALSRRITRRQIERRRR